MQNIQIIEKQLPVINMNFEEIKNSLQATISKYEGLVVTEQGLKDCKATQKELSKIKTTLDKYRLSVKKEMLVPVTEFENQCKELIGLVAAAEGPIKQGILLFDNMKKQEKAEWAEVVLDETILSYKLNDFYKSKIDISDITINLSNSKKSIQEEIETKVKALATEQKQEEERKQNCIDVMKATLESANKDLTVPLEQQQFDFLIEQGSDVAQIVKEINSRVELIRRTERELKEKENLRIEQIKLNEERKRLQDQKDIREKAIAEERERAAIQEPKNIQEKPPTTNEFVSINSQLEQLYSITLEIITDKNKAIAFKKFLQDNNINFLINSQYKI